MSKLLKPLLCTVLVLSACQDRTPQKQTEVKSKSARETSLPKSKTKQNQYPKIESKYLISPAGIGEAKLGMTLGKLKQIADKDTQFKLKPNFMVDVEAIAVTRIGEVQYYVLFVTNTPPQDSDKITYLITQNPQYQTEAGIKVDSTIKQAEEIYGDASFSYNINNESREYVEFEQLPFNGSISMRSNSTDYQYFAGIYSDPQGEHNQTKNYRDDAKIAAIEVSCRPQTP